MMFHHVAHQTMFTYGTTATSQTIFFLSLDFRRYTRKPSRREEKVGRPV